MVLSTIFWSLGTLVFIMARIRAFTNGRVCARGREKLRDFYVDLDTGCIVPEPDEDPLSFVDMQNHILAPAYQELQINGCLGLHFTTFVDSRTYFSHLENVSRHLVSQGVGAFYVTLPTMNVDLYRKVRRDIVSAPDPEVG